jgi:hypothetical protein
MMAAGTRVKSGMAFARTVLAAQDDLVPPEYWIVLSALLFRMRDRCDAVAGWPRATEDRLPLGARITWIR